MEKSTRHYFLLFLKVYVLGLLLSPLVQSAFSLSELSELYQSPQGLGMGNALTADAMGYQAIYYNPAGVANQLKRRWEVTLVDLEGTLGFGLVGLSWKTQSFGPYRFFGEIKNNPDKYYFLNATSVPAITMRGFSISLLNSYQFQGISDGTVLDTHIRRDAGVLVAVGRAFGGGIFKIGATTKALIRNEMKGLFTHDSLSAYNDSTFSSLFKEGWGVGADLGILVTLPEKYLPTLGIVWKDMFGTRFRSCNFLNSQASGKPDSIPQSVNAALSFHPALSPYLKSTIAVEYKHFELTQLPFRNHVHIGFQIEHVKELYFWAGVYQLYPTFGLGWRVKGGNFELTSYAAEIGEGDINRADRRLTFRYTIGF